MSMPRIVISIKLLLFIFFCHFIGVVFLFLFPLRQKHECVYSSFSIVSGSFSFIIYNFFFKRDIWLIYGLCYGYFMLRIVVARYFFCCCVFLISNGSWVWVWVCCYSRFIIIYISFHLHHILTCCLIRLRSTISIPYEQFHMDVFFMCLLLLIHTCIVFVRAFIFHSTDGIHCCCCCHWCWFVIFVFCFGLCRFKLNISAAKQFSSISDSCRCGLENIITPILFDVGTIFDDQFYLWQFNF